MGLQPQRKDAVSYGNGCCHGTSTVIWSRVVHSEPSSINGLLWCLTLLKRWKWATCIIHASMCLLFPIWGKEKMKALKTSHPRGPFSWLYDPNTVIDHQMWGQLLRGSVHHEDRWPSQVSSTLKFLASTSDSQPGWSQHEDFHNSNMSGTTKTYILLLLLSIFYCILMMSCKSSRVLVCASEHLQFCNTYHHE